VDEVQQEWMRFRQFGLGAVCVDEMTPGVNEITPERMGCSLRYG
jgi:hypothetical protein